MSETFGKIVGRIGWQETAHVSSDAEGERADLGERNIVLLPAVNGGPGPGMEWRIYC